MAKDPEGIFDIETIVEQFNTAFVGASARLRSEFEKPDWADSPFVYHMPKMRISMQMSLSYSKGKVRGIITKREKREESEMVSTIDIDLVSVPRSAEEITPPEEADHEPAPKLPDQPDEDESGGESPPPAPAMPTTIILASPNVMWNVVAKSLKKLGFTNVRKLRQDGAKWRVKVIWHGEAKTLEINARKGTIAATEE